MNEENATFLIITWQILPRLNGYWLKGRCNTTLKYFKLDIPDKHFVQGVPCYVRVYIYKVHEKHVHLHPKQIYFHLYQIHET